MKRKQTGVEGFEPPMRGTKNRCLTAWPHPNRHQQTLISHTSLTKEMDRKKQKIQNMDIL